MKLDHVGSVIHVDIVDLSAAVPLTTAEAKIRRKWAVSARVSVFQCLLELIHESFCSSNQ
jgi:hypothetical protein